MTVGVVTSPGLTLWMIALPLLLKDSGRTEIAEDIHHQAECNLISTLLRQWEDDMDLRPVVRYPIVGLISTIPHVHELPL